MPAAAVVDMLMIQLSTVKLVTQYFVSLSETRYELRPLTSELSSDTGEAMK